MHKPKMSEAQKHESQIFLLNCADDLQKTTSIVEKQEIQDCILGYKLCIEALFADGIEFVKSYNMPINIMVGVV